MKSWSRLEDARLIEAVQNNGEKWGLIAASLGRKANECIERHKQIIAEGSIPIKKEPGTVLPSSNRMPLQDATSKTNVVVPSTPSNTRSSRLSNAPQKITAALPATPTHSDFSVPTTPRLTHRLTSFPLASPSAKENMPVSSGVGADASRSDLGDDLRKDKKKKLPLPRKTPNSKVSGSKDPTGADGKSLPSAGLSAIMPPSHPLLHSTALPFSPFIPTMAVDPHWLERHFGGAMVPPRTSQDVVDPQTQEGTPTQAAPALAISNPDPSSGTSANLSLVPGVAASPDFVALPPMPYIFPGMLPHGVDGSLAFNPQAWMAWNADPNNSGAVLCPPPGIIPSVFPLAPSVSTMAQDRPTNQPNQPKTPNARKTAAKSALPSNSTNKHKQIAPMPLLVPIKQEPPHPADIPSSSQRSKDIFTSPPPSKVARPKSNVVPPTFKKSHQKKIPPPEQLQHLEDADDDSNSESDPSALVSLAPEYGAQESWGLREHIHAVAPVPPKHAYGYSKSRTGIAPSQSSTANEALLSGGRDVSHPRNAVGELAEGHLNSNARDHDASKHQPHLSSDLYISDQDDPPSAWTDYESKVGVNDPVGESDEEVRNGSTIAAGTPSHRYTSRASSITDNNDNANYVGDDQEDMLVQQMIKQHARQANLKEEQLEELDMTASASSLLRGGSGERKLITTTTTTEEIIEEPRVNGSKTIKRRITTVTTTTTVVDSILDEGGTGGSAISQTPAKPELRRSASQSSKRAVGAAGASAAHSSVESAKAEPALEARSSLSKVKRIAISKVGAGKGSAGSSKALVPAPVSAEDVGHDTADVPEETELDLLFEDYLETDDADDSLIPTLRPIDWDCERSAFSTDQISMLRRQLSQNFQFLVQASTMMKEIKGDSHPEVEDWQNQMWELLQCKQESTAAHSSLDPTFTNLYDIPNLERVPDVVAIPLDQRGTRHREFQQAYELVSTFQEKKKFLKRLEEENKKQQVLGADLNKRFRRRGLAPRISYYLPWPEGLEKALNMCGQAFDPKLHPTVLRMRRPNSYFMEQEDQLLLKGLQFFGLNGISSIRAHLLPTRTHQQLNSRIKTLLGRVVLSNNPIRDLFWKPFKPLTISERELVAMAVHAFGATRSEAILPQLLDHHPKSLILMTWASMYSLHEVGECHLEKIPAIFERLNRIISQRLLKEPPPDAAQAARVTDTSSAPPTAAGPNDSAGPLVSTTDAVGTHPIGPPTGLPASIMPPVVPPVGSVPFGPLNPMGLFDIKNNPAMAAAVPQLMSMGSQSNVPMLYPPQAYYGMPTYPPFPFFPVVPYSAPTESPDTRRPRPIFPKRTEPQTPSSTKAPGTPHSNPRPILSNPSSRPSSSKILAANGELGDKNKKPQRTRATPINLRSNPAPASAVPEPSQEQRSQLPATPHRQSKKGHSGSPRFGDVGSSPPMRPNDLLKSPTTARKSIGMILDSSFDLVRDLAAKGRRPTAPIALRAAIDTRHNENDDYPGTEPRRAENTPKPKRAQDVVSASLAFKRKLRSGDDEGDNIADRIIKRRRGKLSVGALKTRSTPHGTGKGGSKQAQSSKSPRKRLRTLSGGKADSAPVDPNDFLDRILS
ncbi:uncharacterized protein BJ171DRAFT_529551 [Polychytrium aggregatum]|uniref:uncharacterized protein n=1 Tax=Polychytrium aggregatum TaxID=110093 RepID=UPI0022FDBCD0|nr:uncharacterized protein BJ171DRAFT_529551 [Polychytrium aggregatum]KAI9193291.1 hypothetical protein BJ171DRAFT_529551 [Polychytrium aggregatum]